MRVRSPPRASTEPMNLPRTYGLRLRLIALVLAAVAPFVFLIAMVARQHRFNERSAVEDRALDQAVALADRLDSRFGSIETVLLNCSSSVPNPPILSSTTDCCEGRAELPREFGICGDYVERVGS